MSITTALSTEEFEHGRLLFQQYADSLDFDLSFQDFGEELKTIHRQYNEPSGALLLAYLHGEAIGCIGIRRYDDTSAELKRMYVLPKYRELKIGRRLLEQAIDKAKRLRYNRILLDTLPSMTSALRLYRSFGFVEIKSYRYNPFDEAVYMEKKLK